SKPMLDPSTGIVCERGNAAPASAAAATPNTILKDLVLSSNYDIGMIASAPSPGGGCNMRLTNSQVFAKNVGVSAVGCNDDPPVLQNAVAVELGDGTPAGSNTFQFQIPASGVSVSVGGCVTRMTARGNKFHGMNKGILVQQPL